jgi:hypothetical protein
MSELGSDLGGAVALLGHDVVAVVHDRGITRVLDIPKRASLQVVDADDAVPAAEQVLRTGASQKACAAGNEGVVVTSSVLSGMVTTSA